MENMYNWIICRVGRMFARVQTRAASYQRLKKWYLIPLCLTFSIIRYVSRVKWSNPEEGIASSPTLRSCSYWKGSLWITNNYMTGAMAKMLVFASVLGDQDSIPGQVIPKTQKMVLDVSLLNTQHYKVQIKGNPGKGVISSSTPSYWKGNHRVALDYC